MPGKERVVASKYRCRYPADMPLEEIITKNSGQGLDELLHPKKNPYISGLDKAEALIRKHKEKHSPVTVIGDYDADGVMASSIMKMGLEFFLGYPVKVRLPKRFSEGYGMNMAMVDEIDSGLVITVDNGIAALKEIEAAKAKGLEVIVTDHHLPKKQKITRAGKAAFRILRPSADVLIDPKATKDCEFSEYCGAGLAYRLVERLVSDQVLLDKLRIFAGIATVADVVELHGDNRNLVRDSCDLLNAGAGTKGIRILISRLGIERVTESDYGFRVGPVINASGRLEDDGPSDVLKLVTYDEIFYNPALDDFMICLADELIERNERRKELVVDALDRIVVDTAKAPVVVYDEACSSGIIGIVAGKIAEQYNLPTLVFGGSGDTIKGSGRSNGSVNLKAMLDAAAECFVKYGGHPGAAGMTARKQDLPLIQEKCHKYLEEHGFSAGVSQAYYDKEIRETDVETMLQKLEKYRPFGQGNPQPVFKVGTFVLTEKNGKYARYMGAEEQHIKLFGEACDAVGFDMAYKWHNERVVDIFGTLSWNIYQGTERPQIEMTDIETYQPEESSFKSELASLLNKETA